MPEDRMTGRQNAREMLDEAERAASAGDLAAADRLLRAAAGLQEAELGPVDPDLAYTLNNLAVVAERSGRLDEAETFYRRATAIAAAALPADDPMVLTSRKNLEDFCQAHGLPIKVLRLSLEPTGGLDAFESEHAIGEPDKTASPGEPETPRAEPRAIPETAPPPSAIMETAPPPPAIADTPAPELDVADLIAAANAPEPALPHRRSHAFAWAMAGLAGVAVIGLLLARPGWWPPTVPISSPTATSEPTTPAVSAVPAPAESPAAGDPPETPPPAAAKSSPVPADPATGTTGRTPEASSNPRGLTLPIVQVCRTLSTAGGQWRCVPAADPIAPGPLVLYTRVQSSRDATIFHRWYRGDSLRQSVKLDIRANAREGYRTFSRQTVDRGADWRVEVTDVDGRLLHQQHLVVE